MTPADWQPLIDGLLEAVWIVDPETLKVMSVNRAALSLQKSTREDMVGRQVTDLVAAPEDLLFWESIGQGHQDQMSSETLLMGADGKLIHVTRRVSRVLVCGQLNAYMVGIVDRSEQRRIEGELEKLIAELRAALESTADGMLVIDLDGGIRGYNHRFAEFWALPEELLTRRDDQRIYQWMDARVLDSAGARCGRREMEKAPFGEFTYLLPLDTGTVLECVTLPQYARGQPIGRVYSYRDITRRLANESQLKLAAQVFERSIDAIFITDQDDHIVAVNGSFEQLTGFAKEGVQGHRPQQFVANHEDSAGLYGTMHQRLAVSGVWQGEVWSRRHDGHAYLSLLSMVRVVDEQGNTQHCIGFFKDLSDALAAQRRIEELAYRDALTGLPNRSMLNERFELTLQMAARSGTPFSVLFMDLDHFKRINDSLGHHFGDQVLQQVADRLRHCLRQVDISCRLGGDEFVILLHDTAVPGAEVIAERLMQSLARPFQIDEMEFSLTCSIGIAVHPTDGATMDDLIKNADSAMYAAKSQGRSGYRFYQPQMNLGLLSRMKLDHALREALRRDGFHVHYQPQATLTDLRVFGVEALIRWHDPGLGSVSPAEFIPVAEETGVIVAIGNWVLRHAIQQAADWYRQGQSLVMAVNVSALQFQQSGFVDRLAELLAASGLPAQCLELELTESVLLHDAAEDLQRLNRLAGLGVRLAIDDFGTGYSSLSYLKRFPIDRLKIDRSFVRDVPEDPSDAAIVRAIIAMGQALNLRVIAEGVETAAQRDFLSGEGCDEMQGFLLTRPMPGDELEHWLADNRYEG